MIRRALTLAFTVAALGGCTWTLTLNDVPRDTGVPDPAAVADAAAQDDLAPQHDAHFTGDGGAYCLRPITLGTVYAQPASLWILLDRSSAMKVPFDGTTRGLAAKNALTATIEKYQYSVNFGFLQFPANPTDSTVQCKANTCCAGSLQGPVSNASYVSSSIACGDQPAPPCFSTSSDSPSYDALTKVRDWYNDPAQADWGQSDRYVLIMTASEPSCSVDVNSNPCGIAKDTTTNLVNQHVYVYVLPVGNQLGICMSNISQLGPAPSQSGPGLPPSPKISPSLMLTQTSLASEIDTFVGAVALNACTINLSKQITTPTDPTKVDITFDDSAPIDKNDFSFGDYGHSTITFSGQACHTIMTSKVNKISITTTCNACSPYPYTCPQTQP